MIRKLAAVLCVVGIIGCGRDASGPRGPEAWIELELGSTKTAEDYDPGTGGLSCVYRVVVEAQGEGDTYADWLYGWIVVRTTPGNDTIETLDLAELEVASQFGRTRIYPGDRQTAEWTFSHTAGSYEPLFFFGAVEKDNPFTKVAQGSGAVCLRP